MIDRDESVNTNERRSAVPVRLACVSPSVLGEGPIYLPREHALYWVDIKGKSVNRLSLSTDVHQSWPMPEMLGWIIPRQNQPGFIAGFKSGFARLFLEPLRIEPIGAPESDQPDNRLNDAAVDRHGCIWAGSMDDLEIRPTGCLYRLDAQGKWELRDSGYVVSNGPVFSVDHRVLYHTDSYNGVIYRYRLAADGSIHDKQVFVTFPAEWGSPDGMATDEEDGIWVAHWGGGRLSRFRPDGRLDRSIEMPVLQVTSCCFAGRNLERMFVTTASIGSKNEQHAGCLFEVFPGVRGAPCYAYRG